MALLLYPHAPLDLVFLLLRIKTICWGGSEYYILRAGVPGPPSLVPVGLIIVFWHCTALSGLTVIHQTWHPPLLQGISTGQPAHTDWWLVCVCFYKSPSLTAMYLEDRAWKFISAVTTGCPHRAWEPSPPGWPAAPSVEQCKYTQQGSSVTTFGKQFQEFSKTAAQSFGFALTEQTEATHTVWYSAMNATILTRNQVRPLPWLGGTILPICCHS